MSDVAMTDEQLYHHSIEQLANHLREACTFDGLTIIVALSRKGPRLLEKLFSTNPPANKPIIITEHALPFFFIDKSVYDGKRFQVLIVDDAIYFGSTIKGVYDEIKAYRDYLHLNFEIKVLTAIKAKESKPFDGIKVVAEDVRLGYGHYFVKQVMSDIRASRCPLEVDYPCVSFIMEDICDIDKLENVLQKAYPNQVYTVRHSESSSCNVLLKNVSGSFFNKLRIYPDGNHIHVEAMTPRVIINDVDHLSALFQFAETDVDNYWKELVTRYGYKQNTYPEGLKYSVIKSFVTLAGYLFSFNTFIHEYTAITSALTEAFGQIKDVTLKERDVRYLLGAGIPAERMYDILSKYLSTNKHLVKFYGINLIKFSQQQVFESYDYPSKEDKEILKNHDSHMIYNSKNITQALSAIFFNQNLLIERWSRKQKDLGRERLNFGYTFHSLRKLISDNRNSFPISEDDDIVIHRWIDKRIEQGCIVPQYVCDVTNHIWTRVFRPGENEDAILSHLGRWVCMVYGVMTSYPQLSPIGKPLLEEFLYYLNDQTPSLQSELGVELKKSNEDRHLLFVDDSNKEYNLLDYLESMYILSYENKQYSISSYLNDEDFIHYDTLSDELNSILKGQIGKVATDFEKFGVNSAAPYLMFNFYYRHLFDYDEVRKAIKNLSMVLNNHMNHLKDKIGEKDTDYITTEERSDIFKGYYPIIPYSTTLSVVKGINQIEEVISNEPDFVKTEKNIYQLNLIISFLMAIYLDKDLERLRAFISIPDDYYQFMESMEVKEAVKSMVERQSLHEALTTSSFIDKLQNLIKKSILND